ncbi:hypothetical protein D3C84_1277210 [compost metagenome]
MLAEALADFLRLRQVGGTGATGCQQALLNIRTDQAFAGEVAERCPVFKIDHGQTGSERRFKFAQA